MTNNYTQEDLLDIIDKIDSLHGQYLKQTYKTLWGIYCSKYDIDYNDDNTIHYKAFDLWVATHMFAKQFIY